MTAAFIATVDDLHRVPDGTVISWLRIPGDHTSEAVAFVRREREITAMDGGGRPTEWDNVVWITPGGWQPMTPADAGVTYPATVIRWGEVPATEDPADPLPYPFAIPTIDTGGTWARQAALDAAARVWAGNAVNAHAWVESDKVIDTAERFAAWLTAEGDA